MPTSSLQDLMWDYYKDLAGHSGSLIDLQKEQYIFSVGQGIASNSWADSALRYYALWNGTTNPVSLTEEAFKYYSNLSGLSPKTSYSLADHMYRVFDTTSGVASPPPVTDGLELYLNSTAIDGYAANGAVSKNLLTYNQATVETDASGWVVNVADCSVASDATQFLSGLKSVKATHTGGADNVTALIAPAYTAIKPNTVYTVSAYQKALTVNRNIVVYINWHDSNQAYISSSLVSNVAGSTSAWVQASITATSPSNAAYALVNIQTGIQSTAVESFFWDNIGLWEGSSTDWIAPGFKNTRNLLTYNQATVETDTTGFITQSNCSVLRNVSIFSQGIASLEVNTTGAGGLGFSPHAAYAFTDGQPVKGSTVYTIAFEVYSLATSRTVACQVYWYDSIGNVISTPTIASGVSSVGSWVKIFGTATAPANAAWAIIIYATSGGVASEKHYFDKMGWWEGSSQTWVPPYRGTAIADGTAIDYWRDLSGKERNATQYTAANQPKIRRANKNLLTYNQATVETDTTGLAAINNCGIARTVAAALDGAASLNVTATATAVMIAGMDSAGVSPGKVAISPSTQYTGVASTRAVTTLRTTQLFFEWFDAAQAYISGSAGGTPIANATGSWTQAFETATSPANAAYARIYIQFSTPAAAEVHRIDSMGLWAGASTTWQPPVTIPSSFATVQFDGVDDFLSILAGGVGGWDDVGKTLNNTFSIYIALVPNATQGTFKGIFGKYSGAANLGKFDVGLDVAGGDKIWGSNRGTTSQSTPSLVVPMGAGCVYSQISSPSATSVYTNGVFGSTDSTSIAANPAYETSNVTIGQRGDSLWANVNISAILMYSGAHTTAQRQRVERWLGSIFNIAVA